MFVVDSSESELGILDLIQVFVESLDRMFTNVCELDLIFKPEEVYLIVGFGYELRLKWISYLYCIRLRIYLVKLSRVAWCWRLQSQKSVLRMKCTESNSKLLKII